MPTGPHRIYPKALLLATVLALFAKESEIKAQEFSIEHADCLVRVHSHKEDAYLTRILKEQLTKKNFKVKPFIDGKRILSGELYADFNVTKGKKLLYKKCNVEVVVLKARGNRPSPNDQKIFNKKNSRSVPRITFSGSERCSKAMQEAFIHMPKCIPIGFAAEKK